MEDEMDMRKTRYKQMSTQELLELHGAGILGNTAYDVLESELSERGVTVPSRPDGEKTLAEADEKKHSSSQNKLLILTVSTFLAGVAEFLTETLFRVVLRLPFIQERTPLQALFSIGGVFLRLAIFFITLIVSYKTIKKYIETGKIA